MSRYIKIGSEQLARVCEEFKKVLAESKWPDGKISFTGSLGTVDRKATVFFTGDAWVKMNMLIHDSDKEVGWHGVAKRTDDESKDEYVISDIVVYPQEVTSATVTTDDAEYQNWLDHLDDEVFNNLRMQGHSHVNMGVTPSGVDNTLYDKLLSQLNDEMFYIFMIWNKRGEKTVKIYDMKKNIMFDTSDVTVKVIDDESPIYRWLVSSKEMVKDKVYSYTKPSVPTYTKVTEQENKSDYKKKEPEKAEKKTSGKSEVKVRKGKRASVTPRYGYQTSLYDYYDGLYDEYDEYDDIDDRFGRWSR